MTLYNVLGFVSFLLAIAAASAPGLQYRAQAWYAHLEKPPWTPPDWLFAPAWKSLYFMIAVAGYMMWTTGREEGAILPLVAFALQLLLSPLWFLLFFRFRLPGYAFANIVLLWLSSLATVVLFFPVAPVAAWLVLPFLLWVSFVAGLNYSVWQLNAGAKAGR